MIKIALVVFGVFLSSECAIASDSRFSDQDAKIVLDYLLAVPDKQIDAKQQLGDYQAWSSIVHRTQESVLNRPTINNLEAYLFLIFVTGETATAHTLEEISQHFLGVFERNLSEIIFILDNKRFLIDKTCYALSNSFDMMEPSKAEKARREFYKKYSRDFAKLLDQEKTRACFGVR